MVLPQGRGPAVRLRPRGDRGLGGHRGGGDHRRGARRGLVRLRAAVAGAPQLHRQGHIRHLSAWTLHRHQRRVHRTPHRAHAGAAGVAAGGDPHRRDVRRPHGLGSHIEALRRPVSLRAARGPLPFHLRKHLGERHRLLLHRPGPGAEPEAVLRQVGEAATGDLRHPGGRHHRRDPDGAPRFPPGIGRHLQLRQAARVSTLGLGRCDQASHADHGHRLRLRGRFGHELCRLRPLGGTAPLGTDRSRRYRGHSPSRLGPRPHRLPAGRPRPGAAAAAPVLAPALGREHGCAGPVHRHRGLHAVWGCRPLSPADALRGLESADQPGPCVEQHTFIAGVDLLHLRRRSPVGQSAGPCPRSTPG